MRNVVSHLGVGQRWAYLYRSLVGQLDPRRHRCPACGAAGGETIKRKLLLTALVRCPACRLLYRTPTDPPAFGEAFYQSDYEQGFTTDCPEPGALQRMLDEKFAGTEKDFSSRIAILGALGISRGMKVLDFGASWGYGTWQFQQAGFEAQGFELSRPRARYARERLGQKVVSRLEELDGPFDVFFSNHVLEHVPSPAEAIATAGPLLKPGGLFFAITPNGSADCMRRNPDGYHFAWGMAHPHYLDDQFYRRIFPARPRLLGSTPWDVEAVRAWDRRSELTLSLTGDELLCAVVFPG